MTVTSRLSEQHHHDESTHSLCSFGALDAKYPSQDDVNAYADAYAEQAIEKFHQRSHLACASIPMVLPSDVLIGKNIGDEGGFAVVSDVEMGGKHYAMKHLRPSILGSDRKNFSMAAADLLKEAEFESAFQNHPHIVSIHAKHVSHDCMGNNFIIIDRLTQTLEQRIKWSWSERQKTCQTPLDHKKFMSERLQVALHICETLHFLHSKNVVFRDLKAENLGFDTNDSVKLFDFGLAKELKDDQKFNNGKYKLTGNTGSHVYMAPEVAKGWKYDNTVDVYSFGVLLWEMMSVELSCRDEAQDWQGEVREFPAVDWWPDELKILIKKCCASFAKMRPTSAVVETALGAILAALQNEIAEAELEAAAPSTKQFLFMGSRGVRREAAPVEKKSKESEKKSKEKPLKSGAKGGGLLRRFRK
jgi:serine/threonine protein kinase